MIKIKAYVIISSKTIVPPRSSKAIFLQHLFHTPQENVSLLHTLHHVDSHDWFCIWVLWLILYQIDEAYLTWAWNVWQGTCHSPSPRQIQPVPMPSSTCVLMQAHVRRGTRNLSWTWRRGWVIWVQFLGWVGLYSRLTKMNTEEDEMMRTKHLSVRRFTREPVVLKSLEQQSPLWHWLHYSRPHSTCPALAQSCRRFNWSQIWWQHSQPWQIKAAS